MAEGNGTALAVRDNGTEITHASAGGLAMSFNDMLQRVGLVDKFYREVMQPETDYGVIPGTNKPTLYQPGAQMLDQIFGYVPTFEVMPSSFIDWTRPIPFFHYVIRCRLLSRSTGEVVAEGIGSCNSYEDKYRWRNAKRTCPQCSAEAIIKGKAEYGGGWLCFKKNGGCGAKFSDGAEVIEGQQVGRVENEDTASLENTVSKMAQKRAHIAATLNATGASRIFTQDIEDLPQFQDALRRAEPEAVGERIADVAEQPRVVVGGEVIKNSTKPRKTMTRAQLLEKATAGFKRLHELDPGVVVPDLSDLADDELRDGIRSLVEMIKVAEETQGQANDVVEEDEEAF